MNISHKWLISYCDINRKIIFFERNLRIFRKGGKEKGDFSFMRELGDADIHVKTRKGEKDAGNEKKHSGILGYIIDIGIILVLCA